MWIRVLPWVILTSVKELACNLVVWRAASDIPVEQVDCSSLDHSAPMH